MRKYIVHSLIAMVFLGSCSMQDNANVPVNNSGALLIQKTETVSPALDFLTSIAPKLGKTKSDITSTKIDINDYYQENFPGHKIENASVKYSESLEPFSLFEGWSESGERDNFRRFEGTYFKDHMVCKYQKDSLITDEDLDFEADEETLEKQKKSFPYSVSVACSDFRDVDISPLEFYF